MRRRLALTIAIGATLTVAGASAAGTGMALTNVCLKRIGQERDVTIGCPSPPEATVIVGVTPPALPRHRGAPVSFVLQAGFIDTGPQPLRKITVDFDRHGEIDTSGLPACGKSQIIDLDTAAARGACRRALVGHGTATLDIANAPASVPLSMFNAGTRAGTTKVLIHAASAALPEPVVVPVRVTRVSHGDYGLEATLLVPPIAEGAGSLTSFKVKVGRRFAREGGLAGYATARCPPASRSLRTRMTFDLTGGMEIIGSLAAPCTPKD